MPSSPTKRSMDLLRQREYRVAKVEHWNPWAHIRQDLFGFIDILAIRLGQTLGVQATTLSNMDKRIRKALELPAARDWLLAGNRFEVHGWRYLKRERKYVPKVVRFWLAGGEHSDEQIVHDWHEKQEGVDW